MLKRIHTVLFASALFSCSVAVHADDLQDANRYFKQGQQNAALEKVDSYLASKPKDAQGRFLKGLILTEQGKPNDAIKVFSELTADYPDLPEPYNNLAVLYAGQGQYEKAKQSLEQAIRTHPSYATAHENLGDIYAKMASQAYDRALQLDRSNTGTQTKLAMIQDLFSGNARPKSSVTSRPVTSKPVVATQPASDPVASTSGGDSDLLKSVHAWAAAWSAQNVDQYLAAYADDFRPADGESRSAWAETRRERVSNPSSIKVTLSNISVKMIDATHASVHFKQSYNASHLRSNGRKTLTMVKADGKWLIQEESTK
ncbi:MAG: tetratricopeptide repeat protein [Gallionella sp.]|nr:tetratricopeptide repeat protein [Gallionella sp.]